MYENDYPYSLDCNYKDMKDKRYGKKMKERNYRQIKHIEKKNTHTFNANYIKSFPTTISSSAIFLLFRKIKKRNHRTTHSYPHKETIHSFNGRNEFSIVDFSCIFSYFFIFENQRKQNKKRRRKTTNIFVVMR